MEFGVEVIGVELYGIEVARIAQQNGAARDGLPEEFMKVESEGVGGFDGFQFVAMPRGEKQSAAIGRIHMEPGTRGLSEGCALWQRIDREITDAAPWVPLIASKNVSVLSKRVGNYQYSPAAVAMLIDQLWVR